MTIWLYTVTFNEARILPFFLRHYAQICDRITVVDDRSTDGTRELVRGWNAARNGRAEVVLEDYPHRGGLDDMELLAFAKATYRRAHGCAHWCIWVDPDEFLYHPELLPRLETLRQAGVEVPLTRGYQMIGDTFPDFASGRQITELVTEGIEDPIYAKPCLFMPHVEMNWELGKHYVHGSFNRGQYAGLKLLHYRCLGLEYLRGRHARNYARCSQANKDSGLGVGVYPDYTGHMSEPWFKSVWPNRTKII
ncbi:MAG: glycosyltransferase family 2 protein [Patescibacteria group bacterium]|nr:glycosyltransferase family 2 protein [Patescibacteria group bacterium]